jgi:hypothetical protein
MLTNTWQMLCIAICHPAVARATFQRGHVPGLHLRRRYKQRVSGGHPVWNARGRSWPALRSHWLRRSSPFFGQRTVMPGKRLGCRFRFGLPGDELDGSDPLASGGDDLICCLLLGRGKCSGLQFTKAARSFNLKYPNRSCKIIMDCPFVL